MESQSSEQNSATPVKQDDRMKALRCQVEYYLSDDNLQKDKFFHEKMSGDSQGYLDIDFILNCNKIKKVNATKEEIINACKLSSQLELSGERVRRSGNKPLPELKFLNKKTKRKDEDDQEEDKEAENFDPVILEFSADKEPAFKWKAIQDKYRELNPNLSVAYLRFNNNKGHMGVFNSHEELKFVENFEIEGVNFTVKRCEGDELINFWKEHGSHFEMCIGRNKKSDKKGGRKERGREKKDVNYLKNAVTLGDEIFTDVTKIRARARRILTSTKDGEKIASPDHDFLFDLVKNHNNGELKLKNFSFFTSGKPKEHDYSRCFFIIKNDSSKEDFSVHKCIEKICNENKKKKN
jgi:hypothetical protein